MQVTLLVAVTLGVWGFLCAGQELRYQNSLSGVKEAVHRAGIQGTDGVQVLINVFE